jgi:hypothetical protein
MSRDRSSQQDLGGSCTSHGIVCQCELPFWMLSRAWYCQIYTWVSVSQSVSCYVLLDLYVIRWWRQQQIWSNTRQYVYVTVTTALQQINCNYSHQQPESPYLQTSLNSSWSSSSVQFCLRWKIELWLFMFLKNEQIKLNRCMLSNLQSVS